MKSWEKKIQNYFFFQCSEFLNFFFLQRIIWSEFWSKVRNFWIPDTSEIPKVRNSWHNSRKRRSVGFSEIEQIPIGISYLHTRHRKFWCDRNFWYLDFFCVFTIYVSFVFMCNFLWRKSSKFLLFWTFSIYDLNSNYFFTRILEKFTK